MNTVWKFRLGPGYNEIWAPGDAEPLTAQMQGGELCLWAAVETHEPATPFAIYVAGTGHEMPDAPLVYLSTVQMQSDIGILVWHVFKTRLGATDER